MNTIELKEKVGGFTERDAYSKAILNTDTGALLKYKIMKNKNRKMIENNEEINKINNEINNIKNELSEIKFLLLKITNKE
jgi:hypothetical protein